MKRYDFIIVGAGLYGATFARILANNGLTSLVLERRNHIAGNVFTEPMEAIPGGGVINVHKYGAHIFHTNNENVWKFVNTYAKFNRFTNCPVAKYKDEVYSLPFSMWTFTSMWSDVRTPEQAKKRIEEQRAEVITKLESEGILEPRNLEEQALFLVGKDIYEKLIKGYTQKQWGRECSNLPSFIIKRLPVRYTFDNNYFNALYQGIPIGGYTNLVRNLLDDKLISIKTEVDFLNNNEINKKTWKDYATNLIYTGAIDEYFNYEYGPLEYRTVRFETEILQDIDSYQGNAAVNYTDSDIPWTRIIEHKWFEFGKDIAGKDIKGTIISKEFSTEWKLGDEPYYPVNNTVNDALLERYQKLASRESVGNNKVIFGGRLGEYKYYDMDKTIERALEAAKSIIEK